MLLVTSGYALSIEHKKPDLTFELGQDVQSATGFAFVEIGCPIVFKPYDVTLKPYISWRTWFYELFNSNIPFLHGAPFRDVYGFGSDIEYKYIGLGYYHYCIHGVYASVKRNMDEWQLNKKSEGADEIYVFFEYSLYKFFNVNFKMSADFKKSDLNYFSIGFNLIFYNRNNLELSLNQNSSYYVFKNSILSRIYLQTQYGNTGLRLQYIYNNISKIDRSSETVFTSEIIYLNRWNNDFYNKNICLISFYYKY